MNRSPLPTGGRGHVAFDGDGQAHVEQAHGEAHDLQLLAPAAEDHDLARGRDHLDRRVDVGVVQPVEHPAKFGQRGLVQGAHARFLR